MPPEVYGEAKYDGQKADVWALEIMFVQIALGDYAMPLSFSAMEDAAFAAFVGLAVEEETTFETNEDVLEPETRQAHRLSSPVRISRAELLGHLPRGSRSMVARMLGFRPSKKAVS